MITFVSRSYNDIDHFTPIIYKLRKDTDREVMVLCQNLNYDIHHDFRLRFLRDHYGVKTNYYVDAYHPTLTHKILSWRTAIWKRIHPWKKISPKTWPPFAKITQHFDQAWAEDFFASRQVSLLVFDYAKVRAFITETLFNAARKLGIPTVALPPGGMMWVDKLAYINSFADYDFPDYDFYIMQHERRKKLTAAIGGPEDRMVTLGLPRFTREWAEILQDITPRSISLQERQPERLRVLYIDRPNYHGMDKELLVASIRRMAGLDFVDLMIKPHTRNDKLYFQELAGFGRIVPDIDSLELIRWADVVIGTTSSILLEALIQDKALVFPKYLMDHALTIDQMNACMKVESVEGLIQMLAALKDHKIEKQNPANVQALMTYLVNDGQEQADVLENYKNFLLAHEKIWS